MLKKIILVIIIIHFLIPINVIGENVSVEEETLKRNEIIKEQLDYLNIDELEMLISDINKDAEKYIPKIKFREFIFSLVKGEGVVNPSDLINGIFKMIFHEVIVNSMLMGKILVLAVFCAILTNIQSTFEKNTIGKLAYYICYILLITMVIKTFTMGVRVGKDAIDQMVTFMQALLPTIIVLLTAMGGIASSALFKPIVLGSVSIISTIIKDVIFPLIFFSALIGITGKISDKIQINRIGGLLKEVSITIIGISFTVFMGVISIQGVTSSKVDGVTIRTAKFAIDTFIPIVGGFLSDAMDMVVSCSMLLKNAIGVIGLLVLFVICLLPAVKLISLVFIYRLASAIIEPISEDKIIDCLSEISKSLIMVLATVLSVGVMFFISITIIIGAGNITLMFR
ncbi:stage III sporulation protein AE [Clostridiisalibacter paucivorans]|uniref:stage III sporulation protein AE n=1 Tax=Clostridiisalibacter paucivorans TaxID=408753 RepID=UPI00047DB1C1|nr:stage III sporulation protein AE [Clostridiisalibacter paucivorans]